MEYSVLGPLRVRDGGRDLRLGGPKPRALLATLLVAGGRVVSTAQLIDDLWGEAPPVTALNTLQANIAALRRAVGGRLRTQAGGYLLDVTGDEVDAARFEALNAEAQSSIARDPEGAIRLLTTALACWQGPPFGGVTAGTAVAAAAARLAEVRLAAVEDRAEAILRLGRHHELLVELTAEVRAEPARERLAGLLMLALHRAGRSADALKVMDALRSALDADLGVDPGPALIELEHAIRRDDPTLASPQTTGMPVTPNRFVGRVAELAEVSTLLGHARLLTLVGPGGVGKTRLAIEVARTTAGVYPAGVHMLSLAALPSSGSVTRELAAALGVRELRRRGMLEAIIDHLRDRRVLLVLDNCEHVASACAALSSQILASCAGVRFLATSREPLRVGGEAIWDVPGLTLPEPGAPPDRVGRSDAVALFVERARAHGRPLGETPSDLEYAVSVCRSVDGLPLALELAAARLRGLSLQDVAARLDRRLDLLRGDGREVPPRHLSMRAAIDWSHELLDQDERGVLARLSVCGGGVVIEAAVAIADDGGAPVSRPVEGTVLRLVDKSMLTVAVDPGGHTRYAMLQTVREYAQERLTASGEERATRLRHARWFADRAGQPGDWAGGQGAWLDRLDAERADLRVALGWYLGEGWDPDAALALASAIWMYWYIRGLLGEGRRWLGLALAATSGHSAARARACRAAAALARSAGDFEEAQRHGEASLESYRALEDMEGVAAALNGLSITAQSRGDLQRAFDTAEESLALVRGTSNRIGVAASLNNLAAACRMMGRFGDTERYLLEAREHFLITGDRRGEAAVLCNLALLEARRGRWEDAREHGLTSLAAFHELTFAEGEVDVIELLACVAVAQGDPETALRLLTVASRERAVLGAPAFAPDELELHARAEADATAALDQAARDRIEREAADLTRQAVVVALLNGGRAIPLATSAAPATMTSAASANAERSMSGRIAPHAGAPVTHR